MVLVLAASLSKQLPRHKTRGDSGIASKVTLTQEREDALAGCATDYGAELASYHLPHGGFPCSITLMWIGSVQTDLSAASFKNYIFAAAAAAAAVAIRAVLAYAP